MRKSKEELKRMEKDNRLTPKEKLRRVMQERSLSSLETKLKVESIQGFMTIENGYSFYWDPRNRYCSHWKGRMHSGPSRLGGLGLELAVH